MRTIGLVVSLALAYEGAAADVTAEPRPASSSSSSSRSSGGEAPQQLPRLELERDGGDVGDRDRGFKATIRPDGSVRFAPSPLIIPPALRVFGHDLLGGRETRRRDVLREIEGDRAQRAGENAISEFGPPPLLISIGVGFGGLADVLNRKTAYQFHKRRFLRRTETTRRRMALEFQRERMREELKELGELLIDIWEDSTRSPARRRELLFFVWDDMLDAAPEERGVDMSNQSGSPTTEDVDSSAPLEAQIRAIERERRALAGEARRRVERFIRRNAPQGDERGYSAEELERLNRARLSREPFRPYAGE